MDRLDVEFLVDLATRFYVLGHTQARIARELGVDPATVSRHLKKARDEGIVRIEIRRPRNLHLDLGRELSSCYGIKRAVVVADDEGGRAAVAAAAAEYFSSQLTNGMRVGLTFGRMLSAMVPLLTAGTVSDLDISMLLGGFGRAMPGIQGNELARHIASLYPHSRIHYLQAPLLLDSGRTAGCCECRTGPCWHWQSRRQRPTDLLRTLERRRPEAAAAIGCSRR